MPACSTPLGPVDSPRAARAPGRFKPFWLRFTAGHSRRDHIASRPPCPMSGLSRDQFACMSVRRATDLSSIQLGDGVSFKTLHASRAAPGIVPGTSRTRGENHATRPSSLVELLMPAMMITLKYSATVLLREMSLGTPVPKKESYH